MGKLASHQMLAKRTPFANLIQSPKIKVFAPNFSLCRKTRPFMHGERKNCFCAKMATLYPSQMSAV
jgi:hypothetical protein